MKVRFAALAVALALAVSAMPAVAQQPGPPPGGMGGPGGPGGGRRMAALLNGITLTAPQQARVDSIQASIRAQMPPRTPGQAPDSTAMQLRRVLSARQDSLVRSLLTPEQQATWDRNLQNIPQGMPSRPPGQ
jgi:Spy/CpxP family protein refolding chaperone